MSIEEAFANMQRRKRVTGKTSFEQLASDAIEVRDAIDDAVTQVSKCGGAGHGAYSEASSLYLDGDNAVPTMLHHTESVIGWEVRASADQWLTASRALEGHHKTRRLFAHWKEAAAVRAFQQKMLQKAHLARWRRLTALACHRRYALVSGTVSNSNKRRQKNMVREEGKSLSWREAVTLESSMVSEFTMTPVSRVAPMSPEQSPPPTRAGRLYPMTTPIRSPYKPDLEMTVTPIPDKTPPVPIVPMKVLDTSITSSTGSMPEITHSMKQNYAIAALNAFTSVREAKLKHSCLLQWKVKSAHRKRQQGLTEF